MAKYNPHKVKTKTEAPKYPSAYGSHKSMVSDKFSEFNELDNNLVVCEDEKGFYVTATNKLDNGMADMSRVASIMKRTKVMESYNLVAE